jgi:hypothetical protein
MPRPTPDQVLDAVAAETGYDREAVAGRRKETGLIRARNLAIVLMLERGGAKIGAVAAFMGGRCNASIVKAAGRARDRRIDSAPFRNLHDRVEAVLLGQDRPEREEARPAAKARKCLMCRAEFRSEDAGHRVCDRCKATKAWKSGADCMVYPG